MRVTFVFRIGATGVYVQITLITATLQVLCFRTDKVESWELIAILWRSAPFSHFTVLFQVYEPYTTACWQVKRPAMLTHWRRWEHKGRHFPWICLALIHGGWLKEVHPE